MNADKGHRGSSKGGNSLGGSCTDNIDNGIAFMEDSLNHSCDSPHAHDLSFK